MTRCLVFYFSITSQRQLRLGIRSREVIIDASDHNRGITELQCHTRKLDTRGDTRQRLEGHTIVEFEREPKTQEGELDRKRPCNFWSLAMEVTPSEAAGGAAAKCLFSGATLIAELDFDGRGRPNT
jgi:hypothetical protein